VKRAKTRPKARIGRKPVPVEKTPEYTLEPLNPWLQCGPDTSVTELWKVRERDEKETILHLVYFDRYGWYCEHGRSCKAVAEVRRVVRTMSAIAPRPKSSAKSRARKRK
jgi:hypothetical protein